MNNIIKEDINSILKRIRAILEVKEEKDVSEIKDLNKIF